MEKQNYRVTIRESTYYTVDVEATSKDEAEELAMIKFGDGDGKKVDIEVDIDQTYTEEQLKQIIEGSIF